MRKKRISAISFVLIVFMLTAVLVLSTENVFGAGDQWTGTKIQDIKEKDVVQYRGQPWTVVSVSSQASRYAVHIKKGLTSTTITGTKDKSIPVLSRDTKVEHKPGTEESKAAAAPSRTEEWGIGTVVQYSDGRIVFTEKNGKEYTGTIWNKEKGMFEGEDIKAERISGGYVVHDLDEKKNRVYKADGQLIDEYDAKEYEKIYAINAEYVSPAVLGMLKDQGMGLNDWNALDNKFKDGKDELFLDKNYQGIPVVVLRIGDMSVEKTMQNIGGSRNYETTSISVTGIGDLKTDPAVGTYNILRGGKTVASGTMQGDMLSLNGGLKYNMETGQIINAEGKQASDEELNRAGYAGTNDVDLQAIAKLTDAYTGKAKGRDSRWLRNMKNGVTPWIGGIVNFLNVYDQYSGLAQYGYLYMNDKNWQEWREKVNDAFCKLYLGKECIISNICSMYIDSAPGESIVIARTPAGELTPVTIQAEKSLEIKVVDSQGKPASARLYKITYHLQNPWQDRMKYWIYLKDGTGIPEGTGTASGTLGYYEFPKNSLEGNEATTVSQINPMLFYSKTDYATACLRFDPYIRTHDKNNFRATKREICAPVVQYEGAGTQPYPTITAAGDIVGGAGQGLGEPEVPEPVTGIPDLIP